MNRHLLLGIVLFLLFFSGRSTEDIYMKVRVHSESSLQINGKSNVTDIFCGYQFSGEGDPIDVIFNMASERYEFAPFDLQIPIKELDCGSALVNADMHKTLNAKYFPIINVQIPYLFFTETDIIQGCFGRPSKVVITMNGIRIEKPVKFNMNMCDEGVDIDGDIRIDLTHFDITPPTALFGAIKVDERFEIVVKLKIIRES